MELTKEQKKTLIQFQREELTGGKIYQWLAEREKNPGNKTVLTHIAEDEFKHFQVYRNLTGKTVSSSRWKLFNYKFFAALLGPTFCIRLMENNEADAQKVYAELAYIIEIPPIIADEERHEQELIALLEEDKLNYLGSVVLGLNDALVELTGALAGLTFALQNPSLIALTGSITGIAAAFSMAASEYLSTKSEDTNKHAVKASVYTGIAYLFTVTVLILPYLLLQNVYLSLSLTLLGAVLIIAAFNYFYAVVKNEKFSRRFGEMISLSMGVALLSFGVGLLLRKFIGVDI